MLKEGSQKSTQKAKGKVKGTLNPLILELKGSSVEIALTHVMALPP